MDIKNNWFVSSIIWVNLILLLFYYYLNLTDLIITQTMWVFVFHALRVYLREVGGH